MGNITDIIRESSEVRVEVTEKIFDVIGEAPSPELVTAVIAHDNAPILEGLEWGFNDTLIREKLADTVGLVLLGMEFPTYEDLRRVEVAEKYKDFDERIVEAARSFSATE